MFRRMRTRYLLIGIVLLWSQTLFVLASITSTQPAWERNIAENPSAHNFPLTADQFGLRSKEVSLAIRLRAGALGPVGTLMTLVDERKRPVMQLEVALQSAVKGEKGKKLQFLVTTDFRPQPLSVGIPVELLNPARPHQLLLRYLGFRLDLFVDGVLADQEWPSGTLASEGTRAVTVSKAISNIKLWKSVLSDGDVAGMNGGPREIRQRENRMFGPKSAHLQYWRPRGYNTSAGDAMPFFHDGVLHVFFLLDRRHHQSKWGLGAHQWGHFSTTDLIHWRHDPPALTISREGEASICTGSVFFHEGKYYAFYATRMLDRSEHLDMAESKDGISFHKLTPSPFEEPQPPYKRGANRDPFVFGKNNDYHMMVTAALASPPSPDQAGAIEHLTSSNLERWTMQSTPFLIPGYTADPECTDLFGWRGWYYLLFSEDGVAHYRMSRNQFGPWIKPAIDVLDGPEARVMKIGSFLGDRRIGVAFLADGNFGGHLVFRELLQAADGSLDTTFPPEMTPRGRQVPFHLTSLTGHVQQTSRQSVLGGAGQPASVRVNGTPEDFVLHATLMPGAAASRFGLAISGLSTSKEQSSFSLQVDPSRGRVQWTRGNLPLDKPAFIEGLKELNKPITLEMVAQGTLVDLSINGMHTLVHRLPNLTQRSLSFFSETGELAISNLVVQSLSNGNRP